MHLLLVKFKQSHALIHVFDGTILIFIGNKI